MSQRAIEAPGERITASAGPIDERSLLGAVEEYLLPEDVVHVRRALAYARELGGAPRPADTERTPAAGAWDIAYVVGVAQTLAEAIHIDAISLGAVLLYQAVESGLVTLDEVRARLGEPFGEAVVRTIANIERFDTLQRPGAALRRNARTRAEGEDGARARHHARQRNAGAESLRKMFVAMAEDPRVAVFKIADQLRTMRLTREASDRWRAHDARVPSRPLPEAEPAADTWTPPSYGEEECRLIARETREVYAPLAGRLGMGRVEGELEDLAFAVLEPEEYRWLSEAVAEYTQERGSYVERVCAILTDEMRAIGLEADVSGRVKHLYSIYKKVRRSGSRDLADLYDVLAFRIIVPTVSDCYLALGHVHELWRPKDGRIKDFIANPKPNGYESLHTTVFCLDNRLAEIQLRTPKMHELAEYGVAMHWYYKDVGDTASARAASLQAWVRQVKEWQQELQGASGVAAERAVEGVKADALKERIFVFTPAGDVKELPASSTPLDFAYLVHTDVGNHVAGARVSSVDAAGRLVKKLVPLDYELKNGDVVEILKRKDAHPTRDWLHVARTKSARDKITKYLKAHERDIDRLIGHDRLDRELKGIGLRKGLDDLAEADLEWLAAAFQKPDVESLFVAIGGDKLRANAVAARLREHLQPPAPAAEPEVAETAVTTTPAREERIGASVGGLEGMLTQLASCCNPLPGDALMGFITRGRGVVIHRADCANLAHLLEREPERKVEVDWPKLDGKQHFRAPIVIEAVDRKGLLADVTGVITNLKINMLKVSTTVRPAQRRAVITATLEIQRPDQLNTVIRELQQVPSVETVERKKTSQANAEKGRSHAEGKHARKQ
ncbi:MAG TPA: HD domain-containing protein [Ktedonobacterales bacterium]|nr:HD domain-containing protein [Ktedonobacterales bacterium]